MNSYMPLDLSITAEQAAGQSSTASDRPAASRSVWLREMERAMAQTWFQHFSPAPARSMPETNSRYASTGRAADADQSRQAWERASADDRLRALSANPPTRRDSSNVEGGEGSDPSLQRMPAEAQLSFNASTSAADDHDVTSGSNGAVALPAPPSGSSNRTGTASAAAGLDLPLGFTDANPLLSNETDLPMKFAGDLPAQWQVGIKNIAAALANVMADAAPIATPEIASNAPTPSQISPAVFRPLSADARAPQFEEEVGHAPHLMDEQQATREIRQENAGRRDAEPVRFHAEWTNNGIKLWLGADADAAASVPRLTQQVREWLNEYGVRVLSIVYNGKLVYDGEPDEHGGENDRPVPEESEWFRGSRAEPAATLLAKMRASIRD